MVANSESNPRLAEEDVAELLQKHGIVPTRQRVQIAAVLLAHPQHLSADQLLQLVNQDGAAVAKATIYNTLGLFVKEGLVREVMVERAKVFYDSNMARHYHLYDVDSGELRDIDAAGVEVTGLPDLPKGTRLEGMDLVIRVRRSRG
ncbi:MAG: transcriptional repressor [Gammaproteobacteria bacterium]|nr:transcriptional repressor [Gammaproteobacteria bacterium]